MISGKILFLACFHRDNRYTGEDPNSTRKVVEEPVINATEVWQMSLDHSA